MLRRLSLGAGVRAAFTDRYGGVSSAPCDTLNLGTGPGAGDSLDAVRENRRRVAERLGLERVSWMRQVHGNVAAYVKGSEEGESSAADAVITGTGGLALAVVVADCVPVLIADATAGVVGAAHAGRAGLVDGVVPALLSRATESGARPGRVSAMIGPAICGECYEVPTSLQADVAAVAPVTRCRTKQGTAGLDLRAGVEAQLRAAGVARVWRDPRCTLESPELYSHRRDGRTGRFGGYVWLSADE